MSNFLFQWLIPLAWTVGLLCLPFLAYFAIFPHRFGTLLRRIYDKIRMRRASSGSTADVNKANVSDIPPQPGFIVTFPDGDSQVRVVLRSESTLIPTPLPTVQEMIAAAEDPTSLTSGFGDFVKKEAAFYLMATAKDIQAYLAFRYQGSLHQGVHPLYVIGRPDFNQVSADGATVTFGGGNWQLREITSEDGERYEFVPAPE